MSKSPHAAAHPERLSDATADDLAREIACEQIFEGVGLDVEDANETRADPNVGIWVTVRVLVKDEAIGSYRETKSFLEGFK